MFSGKCFSYFSMKTFVMGTHLKHLTEALLVSTHNICFNGEVRKYQHFLVENMPYLELC